MRDLKKKISSKVILPTLLILEYETIRCRFIVKCHSNNVLCLIRLNIFRLYELPPHSIKSPIQERAGHLSNLCKLYTATCYASKSRSNSTHINIENRHNFK